MAKSNPAPKNPGKKASSKKAPVINSGVPTDATGQENETLDTAVPDAANSNSQGNTPATQTGEQPTFGGEPAKTRSMTMDLKLTLSKAPRKSQRLVIYNIEGRTGSVQFLSTLFGGDQKSQGNPPAELTLSGEFAEPKAPKVKETPEERKARLKALPKLTLEQKVQRAEERAAALKEKLAKQAAEAAAKAAAPAGEPVAQ